MLTYHQIKGLMEKVDVLAGQIGCLRESINTVIQFSEVINSLNADLRCERDRISHEIRSVEVLDQILQKYVYGQSVADQPGNTVSGEATSEKELDRRPSVL